MAVKRYDFFISYAHEDIERVRELDKALRALLRRPLRRAGFHVFRDETSLAADPDLTSRLRAALDQSSWLLVALTPASAKSPWVDREIEYWCEELGRAERLLIVRADPNVDLEWDEGAGRFRSPTSLPPALLRAATAQPLYVEMRPGPVEEAAVRVAAAVLDRSPDDIAGEDLRLHRRRKRLATAAIAGLVVLTLASVAASVLAIRSSAAASRNEERAVKGEQEARDQAQKAVADAMAARALVEASERPDKAFALALASSRLDPSGSGEAVLLRLAADAGSTDRFFRIDAEPTAVALSPAGDTYAIGDAGGGIRLGVFGSEPEPPSAHLGSSVVGIGFLGRDRIVAGLGNRRIVELEVAAEGTLTQRSSVSVPALDTWAFDPSSGKIAVLGLDDAQERNVLTLVASSDVGLQTLASQTQFESFPAALSFERGGTRLAVSGPWALEFFDTTTALPLQPASDIGVEVESMALRADGAVVAAGTPATSADQAGLLTLYAPDGADLGSTGFARSVDSVAACGKRVVFGTSAGEYGWLGDPVSSTRNIGDVLEGISSIACARHGRFVVVGARGFVHTRARDPESAANVFPLYGQNEPVPAEDRLQLSLTSDLAGLRTDADERLPFTESGEGLAELLAGESPLESNCASLASLEIGSAESGEGREQDDRVLATCGGAEIRVPGPTSNRLAIWKGGAGSFEFGSGTSPMPYALAWSADGRRAFVGSHLEGMLYELGDQAPPQEILRLTSPALFAAASFVAGGHALITVVDHPPAYWWDSTLYVIGGAPLQRLACLLGGGSLEDTVAIELLRGFNPDTLGCEAVDRESGGPGEPSG